jgi:hypothetical protein
MGGPRLSPVKWFDISLSTHHIPISTDYIPIRRAGCPGDVLEQHELRPMYISASESDPPSSGLIARSKSGPARMDHPRLLLTREPGNCNPQKPFTGCVGLPTPEHWAREARERPASAIVRRIGCIRG